MSIFRKLAKNILKILVSKLGFHLTRMRSDMEDVLSHLKEQEVSPNTVIDVGVANGTDDLYKAFRNSHIVLVEPLQEFEDYMRSMKTSYDLEYHIAAASDNEGTLTINVHPDLCGSSLLKEVEGNGIDGVERVVPTVRLDRLALEKGWKPPFFIKIDVQGAELKVLEGAEGILDQTDAVSMEVSFFGFFVGGPQFHEVVDFMSKRGFVPYEIFDGRNRPLDDALAQVDMLFVKKNGVLRGAHSYANPEQRENMNRVIRKKMVGN